MKDNFPNDGGGDCLQSGIADQKKSLHIEQIFVELSYAFLTLKISGIAKTSKNKGGTDFLTKLSRQVLVLNHLNPVISLQQFLQPLEPRFQRE